jgi:hypothetical protein
MRQRKLASALLAWSLLCSFAAADTLVLKSGVSHDGTLVSATSSTITFKEDGTIRRYDRADVDSVQFDSRSAAEPQLSDRPQDASTNSRRPTDRMTLPAGSEIAVLTNENIDSQTATSGQTFPAEVAENLTNADGEIVIPKGAEAELVLRDVSSGGVTKGSELTLDLQSVNARGHRYEVSTEEIAQKGSSGLGANKRTAEMVGGGAVLGTLIGAIAGGGKGAAIGAAAGAATGAGAQVLTRGKSVKVPAETTLRFKLDQPLVLHEAY